jgi:two-component system sensor histidine kinase KdpD
VLVSQLSDQARRQAQLSEARRQEVERLYEFSQQLLLHDDLRGLARSTPSLAAAVFGFRAVALYVMEEDVAYYSDPENELLPAVDLKLVAQTAETGTRVTDGVRMVPLMLGVRSTGTLAMSEGHDYSEGMYEAVSGLVAIALERAAALERSSRLEASRESERLRSALLDSVTHDLRTPLTAIRAAATTLVSQPGLAKADQEEMFAVVDEESARLDRLIGQAMEMAQLDSASVQVKAKPQHLRELVDLVLEEARPWLRDRTVEVALDESLPAIPMDRELVRRVLRHLMENAVRYSPAGSTITVSGGMDGTRLLVSVADEGPGISESDQPFIFEKFFRGKNQRQKVPGTGMGLAIVKAILRAHGGGIEVKTSGIGTVFTFWIPAVLGS